MLCATTKRRIEILVYTAQEIISTRIRTNARNSLHFFKREAGSNAQLTSEIAPDGIGRYGSLMASISLSYQSLIVCAEGNDNRAEGRRKPRLRGTRPFCPGALRRTCSEKYFSKSPTYRRVSLREWVPTCTETDQFE